MHELDNLLAVPVDLDLGGRAGLSSFAHASIRNGDDRLCRINYTGHGREAKQFFFF